MAILAALASVIFVSLLSLGGALFLVLNRRTFESLITYTVAFSSGVLLGSAFLDLLPESLVILPRWTFPFALAGMIIFFGLEKFLRWHHHIEGDHRQPPEKAVAYLSLLGDGIHNFIDGVIIATAYLVSIPLGVTTTVAVVAHEIPHELADFTILVYGGFSSRKALVYNFLSAFTSVAGAILVFIISTRSGQLVQYLLPFAAGNFIYIAACDLIPELHKKRELATSVVQLLLLIIGVLTIAFIRTYAELK